MKTLRVGRICLTSLFFFFLLFESHAALHAQQTAAQPDANVKFQWAFGALKKANGSKFEAVAKDTNLKTGDQIKFFFHYIAYTNNSPFWTHHNSASTTFTNFSI